MTLKELFASLDTVTVTLGGMDFAARRVTGIEMDLITRIFPRPEAPLIADPDKGSRAPMVPDLADAKYKASEEGWFADYVMSVVAVGLGHTAIGTEAAWPLVSVDNHRDATVRAQAEAYLREARPVVQRVGWNHLLGAFNAIVRGAVEGGGGIETAAKN
jgi:hypothetical protein